MSKFLVGFQIFCVFLVASCNNEKVVLRFSSASMNAQKYQLTSQLDLVVGKEQAHPHGVGSHLRAVLQAEPQAHYNDASSRYRILVDSVQYESKSRTKEEILQIENSLRKQKLEFKMGSAGEMQDFQMDAFVPELDGSDIDLRRLLLKIQPVLPGSPVAVGDTWERQQLLPESNGQKVYVYKWFRVEEIFQRSGQQLVKMSMNIRYKPRENAQMKPEGNDFILGSGYVVFNESEGQVDDAMLEINGLLNVLANKKSDSMPSLRIRQLIHLKRQVP